MSSWLTGFLILECALLVTANARDRQNPARFTNEDPNSRFVCEGHLAEYAACQCKEDEGEVSCINAQFVDTNVFTSLGSYYKYLNKITFHGNNFQDLPSGSIFGPSASSYSNLDTLNISANYIVNLHYNALEGLRGLHVLDLSNNEIVLKDSDLGFLQNTPQLTELYLRRAFTSTINRTVQFEYMMRMFERAKLDKLEILDLSYNYLTTVPFDLPCPFPALTRLDLRQNFLTTFSVNETCLASVRTIDLSRNQIHSLDAAFRTLANGLKVNTLALRNSFYCDCKSADYIQWIRGTNVIRDKNTLICDKASPRQFLGARIVEVPLDKLDCSLDVWRDSGVALTLSAASSILAALLTAIVLLI